MTHTEKIDENTVSSDFPHPVTECNKCGGVVEVSIAYQEDNEVCEETNCSKCGKFIRRDWSVVH